MLIAAALIELDLAEAESIKAKRRVVRSIKDRVASRFNVSIAEVDDHDDRHSICLGCVHVGVDPRHLREKMEQVIRFVDRLGLAELVGDEVTVARLAELQEVDEPERSEGRSEPQELADPPESASSDPSGVVPESV